MCFCYAPLCPHRCVHSFAGQGGDRWGCPQISECGGHMAVSLFDPIKLGAIDAPTRIVMAPLTRGHAGPGFVPNELARESYPQRASEGSILSDTTGNAPEGLGWPSPPCSWTDAKDAGVETETARV